MTKPTLDNLTPPLKYVAMAADENLIFALREDGALYSIACTFSASTGQTKHIVKLMVNLPTEAESQNEGSWDEYKRLKERQP